MRSREFHAAIGALWARLGLGAPRPDDEGNLVLRIDSFALSFEDSPDRRHLLVSGKAGELSPERETASEQVRQLLKTGLGFLLSSRVCLRLGLGAREREVIVEAACPYSACSPDLLSALVEEIVNRLEFHRMQLAPSTRRVKEEETAFIVRL